MTTQTVIKQVKTHIFLHRPVSNRSSIEELHQLLHGLNN